MTIQRVAEDAYFVPSYSDDTLAVNFQFGVTNQGIPINGLDEVQEEVLPESQDQPFSEQDFEDAIRRVIRRL